jgi:AraC-like DNA-binding protein
MTIRTRVCPQEAVGSAPIVEVEHGLRTLVVLPASFVKGHVGHRHRHRYGQLIHAISGMLVVRSPYGSWAVPSGRGVWVPPLLEHAVDMLADTQMRSVYLNEELSARIAGTCRVIGVPKLLRELILYAVDHAILAKPELETSVGTLVAWLISSATPSSLGVPIPTGPVLRTIYSRLLDDPSDQRTITAWARSVGATERTLIRHLKNETGMTFRVWRQQIRLLSSLDRLAKGEAVTTVALDVGYNTPSGFITAFRQSFGKTPAAYFDDPRK